MAQTVCTLSDVTRDPSPKHRDLARAVRAQLLCPIPGTQDRDEAGPDGGGGEGWRLHPRAPLGRARSAGVHPCCVPRG